MNCFSQSFFVDYTMHVIFWPLFRFMSLEDWTYSIGEACIWWNKQWPFGTNSRPWSSWGRSPPSRDVQTSWSRTAPCPVWSPKSKVWGKKGDPGCQTHQPSCCKIPVWSPATRGHASNVVNRSLQVVNNSRFSEMSKRQCLHISYVWVPLERPPEAELLQYQPAVLVFTSRIFCFESSADSL